MMLRARIAAALAAEPPLLLPGDLHADEHDAVAATPAAVLVPVVDRPRPTLILTRRTETLRRHPGQIAFPGGRLDPEDAGPVEAALREAEEEIGLPRGVVDVIGTADIYRTVTGFAVTPVVGIVPPDLPLIPHDAEVSAVFEVPLDFALDVANQIERAGEFRGRERRYYEIVWGEWRIWGATAAMIVNLGRRLAHG